MSEPKKRSRERITKPCAHCGKDVTRLKSADAPNFFCNHQCYWASDVRAAAGKRTMEKRHPNYAKQVLTCDGCGAEVLRHQSKVAGKQTFCSIACRWNAAAATPIRQVNAGGYIKIYVGPGAPGATKTGHIMEHRKVMQDMIGRPLIGAENVHHINGVKHDNRPENLELWSSSQPAGQRVDEKVAWAREMLALYGDLFPE